MSVKAPKLRHVTSKHQKSFTRLCELHTCDNFLVCSTTAVHSHRVVTSEAGVMFSRLDITFDALQLVYSTNALS